jgi:hypothetical protein
MLRLSSPDAAPHVANTCEADSAVKTEAVEVAPLLVPSKEPDTVTLFPVPGRAKPEPPLRLAVTAKPPKLTTLGLMTGGVHITVTLTGSDCSRPVHALVPPVMVALAVPDETDRADPDTRQPCNANAIELVSGAFPNMVSAGEKVADPVMAVHETVESAPVVLVVLVLADVHAPDSAATNASELNR